MDIDHCKYLNIRDYIHSLFHIFTYNLHGIFYHSTLCNCSGIGDHIQEFLNIGWNNHLFQNVFVVASHNLLLPYVHMVIIYEHVTCMLKYSLSLNLLDISIYNQFCIFLCTYVHKLVIFHNFVNIQFKPFHLLFHDIYKS